MAETERGPPNEPSDPAQLVPVVPLVTEPPAYLRTIESLHRERMRRQGIAPRRLQDGGDDGGSDSTSSDTGGWDASGGGMGNAGWGGDFGFASYGFDTATGGFDTSTAAGGPSDASFGTGPGSEGVAFGDAGVGGGGFGTGSFGGLGLGDSGGGTATTGADDSFTGFDTAGPTSSFDTSTGGGGPFGGGGIGSDWAASPDSRSAANEGFLNGFQDAMQGPGVFGFGPGGNWGPAVSDIFAGGPQTGPTLGGWETTVGGPLGLGPSVGPMSSPGLGFENDFQALNTSLVGPNEYASLQNDMLNEQMIQAERDSAIINATPSLLTTGRDVDLGPQARGNVNETISPLDLIGGPLNVAGRAAATIASPGALIGGTAITGGIVGGLLASRDATMPEVATPAPTPAPVDVEFVQAPAPAAPAVAAPAPSEAPAAPAATLAAPAPAAAPAAAAPSAPGTVSAPSAETAPAAPAATAGPAAPTEAPAAPSPAESPQQAGAGTVGPSGAPTGGTEAPAAPGAAGGPAAGPQPGQPAPGPAGPQPAPGQPQLFSPIPGGGPQGQPGARGQQQFTPIPRGAPQQNFTPIPPGVVAAGPNLNQPQGRVNSASGQVESDLTTAARAYLLSIATPGNTMTKQGVEKSIDRLHPLFAERLAAAMKEARDKGIPVSPMSTFRSPEMGANPGFATRSMHGVGGAVDVTGIGKAGSRDSKEWNAIALKHGLYNPYGPNNAKEWNHYQLLPGKVAPTPNPRQTPADIRTAWQRSNVPFEAGTPPGTTQVAGGPPSTEAPGKAYQVSGPGREGVPKTVQSGGQQGRSFVNGKEFSSYAPGTTTGRAMEGPYKTSQPGLNGKFTPVTADHVRHAREQGKDIPVTLASHPSRYGKTVEVGDYRYQSPEDGKWYVIPNMKGYVHDTGPDFQNANRNNYDIATGDFRGKAGGSEFVSRNSVSAPQTGVGMDQPAPAPTPSVPGGKGNFFGAPPAVPGPRSEAPGVPGRAEAPSLLEQIANFLNPISRAQAETLPAGARGLAMPHLMERTATQIAEDMRAQAKAKPGEMSMAKGQQALNDLAKALSRAAIPADIAGRAVTMAGNKGLQEMGYANYPGAQGFLNGMIAIAMAGYKAGAPGPAYGPVAPPPLAHEVPTPPAPTPQEPGRFDPALYDPNTYAPANVSFRGMDPQERGAIGRFDPAMFDPATYAPGRGEPATGLDEPTPAPAAPGPSAAPGPGQSAPAAPTASPASGVAGGPADTIAAGLAAAAAYGQPGMTFGEAVGGEQPLRRLGVPASIAEKLADVPAVPLEQALEHNDAGKLASLLTRSGFKPDELAKMGGLFAQILASMEDVVERVPTLPTMKKGGKVKKSKMTLAKKRERLREIFTQNYRRGFLMGQKLRAREAIMGGALSQGGLVEMPGRYQSGGVPLPRRDPRWHLFDWGEGVREGEVDPTSRGRAQRTNIDPQLLEYMNPWISTLKKMRKLDNPHYQNPDEEAGRYAWGGSMSSLSKIGRPHPHHGGAHLVQATTPGRTDRIRMNAKPGSFVIPADVVSGMGQGNTAAGAKIFGELIASGPYGAKATSMKSGRLAAPHPPKMPGMPKPSMLHMPAASRMPKIKMQEGGEVEEPTPIIVAGGEIICDPEVVKAYGGGDPEKGHKCMSEMVLNLRKQNIKQLSKLPGPIS